ncbi:HipA domain-containing protein [Leucobacter sp. CSA1]|uniref:HipA domain-containing protein n=1 Tax=Leucobacter chromiisoli TaxID=2796471 RepID=A0A934UUU8_9MICO|nr:HipA domain-containing protein [Leucobacter chromiisoli]MBK0419899.1 HipA domain-containing protein [Leucobacter chromiisoli]
MTRTLDVYLYGERIATIDRLRSDLRLRYTREHIAGDDSVPISVQFPVTPELFIGRGVRWFLENLLPDRPDVKEAWAVEAGLDSTDAFDLLAVYGADVAGALEFYPQGRDPRDLSVHRPIHEEDIAARIRSIRADDSRWTEGIGKNAPFSLGGAQGKFALARRDGQWCEPTGTAPSTHIIKPGVKNFEGSDVTEHITMETARRLGIPVARTHIELFAGEHALVVERFDRIEVDGRLIRIHQEDLAQATATPTIKKYESTGGPGYRRIFDLFDRYLDPGAASDAKLRFAESLVFSWIIGHADGHSKNYSLTLLPEGSFLSPLYDLNCNPVFEPEATCRAKDYRAFDSLELAFSVGGKRALGEFDRSSLRILERDAGLQDGYLATYAFALAARLVPTVNEIIDELPEKLRLLTAVKNFPFVAYSQLNRVADVLDAPMEP